MIEPLLAGEASGEDIPPDDIQYARDLGLITVRPQLAIANGIYQEVIPRELTWSRQVTIAHQTEWYLAGDGQLDMNKLLAAFQQFSRENSEHWIERFHYKEAGPQLLLQAFLQRILNGGGNLEREYGLGCKRTDLFIRWPYAGGVQRIALELKLARAASDKALKAGLDQTVEYMDRCGAREGHLVIFDRSRSKTWDEKIYQRAESHRGRAITVRGM